MNFAVKLLVSPLVWLLCVVGAIIDATIYTFEWLKNEWNQPCETRDK